MSTDETRLDLIRQIETVDVVADDIIKALWSEIEFLRGEESGDVFAILEPGKHVFAEHMTFDEWVDHTSGEITHFDIDSLIENGKVKSEMELHVDGGESTMVEVNLV